MKNRQKNQQNERTVFEMMWFPLLRVFSKLGLPIQVIGFLYQCPIPLWCRVSELNQRHGDFQSPALPTELTRHILDAKEKIVGFEPTTDCLTDNCSTR